MDNIKKVQKKILYMLFALFFLCIGYNFVYIKDIIMLKYYSTYNKHIDYNKYRIYALYHSTHENEIKALLIYYLLTSTDNATINDYTSIVGLLSNNNMLSKVNYISKYQKYLLDKAEQIAITPEDYYELASLYYHYYFNCHKVIKMIELGRSKIVTGDETKNNLLINSFNILYERCISDNNKQ